MRGDYVHKVRHKRGDSFRAGESGGNGQSEVQTCPAHEMSLPHDKTVFLKYDCISDVTIEISNAIILVYNSGRVRRMYRKCQWALLPRRRR